MDNGRLMAWALWGLCLVALFSFGCGGRVLENSGGPIVSDASFLSVVERAVVLGGVDVLEPLDGAVYPKGMAPPLFEWRSQLQGVDRWVVGFRLPHGPPILAVVEGTPWRPDARFWQGVLARAGGGDVEFFVCALGGAGRATPLGGGRNRFTLSPHGVGGSILYRQLPLPYARTQAYVERITWKLGSVGQGALPRTVMAHQSVCSGCHQSSADGTLLSMEMNVGGDSGAQWVMPVSRQMVVTPDHTMTWQDYPKPPFFPETRGGFAKLSPTGRFMVSPVNEISFMALTGETAYSQLFFPTFGFLGVYDRQRRAFAPLPGAQDWDYVHTDPSWFPDESALLFARAPTMNEYHPDLGHIQTLEFNLPLAVLNKRFPARFDLYRIPFNGGKGGEPLPFKGASANGWSNYFGRVSPDGRWVAFTRSRSGMMLQPDSALYLVSAAGGEARRMACNRGAMNSWHAWSPNGRWLVFASKGRSIYTELYLTHVDENGMDSPAIRLDRFSDPRMAANIPEFVAFEPDDVECMGVNGCPTGG